MLVSTSCAVTLASHTGGVDDVTQQRWQLLLKAEYVRAVQQWLEPADCRQEGDPAEPSVAADYRAHGGICWCWGCPWLEIRQTVWLECRVQVVGCGLTQVHRVVTGTWMHTGQCPWSSCLCHQIAPPQAVWETDCSCSGEPSAGKILFCHLAIQNLIPGLVWVAQFGWIGWGDSVRTWPFQSVAMAL